MTVPLRTTASAARRDEAGAVLVLFALLLVGAFGLLAAIVDGGRLRATSQQLDAGAESAALEGVRFKDSEGDGQRRDRAIAATARQWDDDLDPSNGDVLGLGAGSLPVVADAQPLGGRLDVAPSAALRVWKPASGLQHTLGNAAHGDLVAGTHIAGMAPGEDDAFARPDFSPTAPGSAAAELAAAPAFLVRLRRATDRLALDRQPGESSAGPAFDWLWARGAAWHEPGAFGTGQSRADGLTVRATSIASTERALLVSDDPAGGATLARIALRGEAGSAWNATPPGASLSLELDPNGLLTAAGVEQGIALVVPARAVGDALAAAASDPAIVPGDVLVLPVYGAFASERRVVGFTLGIATSVGATVTLVRQPGAVLPTGASSVSPAALDARLALAATPALAALHTSFAEPVLAPVLRR